MKHLSMIDALGASGPHTSLGADARLFDQFVGSWELDCVFTAADGQQSRTGGEWHFGWILAGRALQDVLFFYPPDQRPRYPADLQGGTTVRLFDPKARQWLVSWFGAVGGFAIHLRGGAVDERIVLDGRDVDASALRWSFNDIGPDAFRWLGETSADGGNTWRVEQEMRLRRRRTQGE